MPSNITIKIAGVVTDLDAIFKPRNGSTPRANVNFKANDADLADRYYAASYNGANADDRPPANTGLTSGNPGIDLRNMFRAIAYADGPAITVQPIAATRNVGASMTLSVTATGTGTLLYLWKRDVGAGYVTAPGTATNSTYTISSLVAGDQGSYKCTVTDSIGSTDTTPAVETVNFLPSFSTNPTNGTVNETNAASFTVVVTVGRPTPFTYAWQRRLSGGSFVTIDATTDGGKYTGTTLDTLSFNAAASDHNSDYRCVATNAAGSVNSTSANLSVNHAPIITAQPIAGNRSIGGTITFTVAATGTGTLLYQWQKASVDIPGATSASYVLSSIAANSAAGYRCNVTNALGTVSSDAAALHVIATVTADPVSFSHTVGTGPYALSCSADGEGVISFQWFKDSVPLSGATGSQHVMDPGALSDNALYFCRVSNSYGADDSSTVTVTFTDVAPVITGGSVTSPTSYYFTVSVDPANFTVVATGLNLTYQWYKGGVAVSGQTAAVYSLGVVTSPSQTGIYSVTVTNSGGEASESVYMEVSDIAPVVDNSTSSVHVPVPGVLLPVYAADDGVGEADFVVNFSTVGTNVVFVWKKDGTVLSSYTTHQGPFFDPPYIADSGNYSVEITNGEGTLTASAVMNVT